MKTHSTFEIMLATLTITIIATATATAAAAAAATLPETTNIKTHPNFQSVVEDVQNAKTIFEYVGHALQFQKDFDKEIIPSEINEYDYDDDDDDNNNFGNDKLEKFKIDLEKIDRLYYIKYTDDQTYRLVARMQYNKEEKRSLDPIYVEMYAFYDYYSENIKGIIYVSRNVNDFMKFVFYSIALYNRQNQKYLICESLKKDGIYIDEMEKILNFHPRYWNSLKPLFFRSHLRPKRPLLSLKKDDGVFTLTKWRKY